MSMHSRSRTNIEAVKANQPSLCAACVYYATTVTSRKPFYYIVSTLIVFTMLFTGFAPVSATEIVVITSPKSNISKLTQDEVVNIFMGRTRQLSSGISIIPVDLPASLPEKALFYQLLVNKDLTEINSYWTRLRFSGRIPPSMVATSTAHAIEIVARTPGAIGYIDKSKINDTVIQVLELNTK